MLPRTGTPLTAPNSRPSEDSGAASCMTSEHNGSELPKRGLENPEFLNSGILAGEHTTLKTGSKTPPYKYREMSTPASIPKFRSSGILGIHM